ncbi:MAG: cadherin repeat domain-containing protein, partial [Acidimicrobiia bacterium]
DSGSLTDVQDVAVTVVDVVENTAPVITSPAVVSVDENQTGVVDVESADDNDSEGAGLVYSLTGGADQSLFTITADFGVLTFLAAPDFETPGDVGGDNVYDVQVTVTDSGSLTDVQDVAVTVVDVVENPPGDNIDPVVDVGQVLSVLEDAADASVVGMVTAWDNVGVTGFQITGGDPDGVFAIDASGQVTVADNRMLDYETTTQYLLLVTASDAASNVSAAETVTVDVDDAVEPTVWVAYNDMNVLVGSPNPANVTDYDYEAAGERLVDYTTGLALAVKFTGSWVNGYDPVTTGENVTAAPSLAYDTFNGIVDLAGNFELDAADWDNIVTITGLDPAGTYTLTVAANRDRVAYNGKRWTRVTLGGADTATNASSSGTVVNLDGSVSFSVGYNTPYGEAVRFTGINPGSDGTITIKSEWDTTQPGKKGYAMTALKIETE